MIGSFVENSIAPSSTVAVHAVWLKPEDLELLAHRGVKVSHCPESNLKLAAGVAPIPELLKLGVTVGLGTDGAASNNNLDLWGEMSLAARLHKVWGQATDSARPLSDPG